MDSGSPVSFIKLTYVPSDAIDLADEWNDRFNGINNSSLVVLGRVSLDVELYGGVLRDVGLLVVPADTMKTPVVLGRDVLVLDWG